MDDQIIRFHKDGDIRGLQNYIKSSGIDVVCSAVETVCAREDGAYILQALFNEMPSTTLCQENRMKIVRAVLQHIDQNLMSPKMSEKLISVLGTQVESFSSDSIVTLINACLQMMKNSKEIDSSNCWKDFIPKLLNKISEIDFMEHNGSRISGADYKNEIIIAICFNEWPDNIITNIASMFVDISLSNEEHLKVVLKLCKRIQEIKIQEVPPLVHQTLQLTKERNFMPLFLALVELFDEKLYQRLSINNKCSEFTNDTELKEVIMTEGTVLYHIYSTISSVGPQSVKDFLKTLKECVHVPQFILRPFSLTFLLTISCVSYTFEEEVLNILKSTILRALVEQEKLFESAWIGTILSLPLCLDELIEIITNNCFRDRDKVLKGLVNMGFTLLGTAKLRGREALYDKIWSLGNHILVRLTEKYRDVTSSILQLLANQISQAHDSGHYIDCLSDIVRKNPLNLLDCSTVLMQLLDNICGRLPGNVGQRVVAVILPLTRMSQSLRDNLVIVLRKSLFPQDKTSREMAVIGMLELLKNLKISNMQHHSQSISQNYCALTQIYNETALGPGPSHSNEGMCLELLSILREVFKHQHEVKTIFYRGLYECVYDNPELGYHVLDSLQNQFDNFYVPGCEIPPIQFDKVVVLEGSNAVLKEPIAQLVFSLGLVVAKMEETDTKCSKLRTRINSLCERMSNCDVPHFVMGQVLCDGSPESLVKEEQVRQVLGVYEALIAYMLCSWRENSVTNGQILSSLFKAYSRLFDFMKDVGKAEKKKVDEKGKNKKADKGTEKKKEKNKIIHFRFPPTVLNFKCVCRLLSLLYETSVSWAAESTSLAIKTKRELHRYCLNVLITLLKHAQQMPTLELRSSSNIGYITKIGKILYTKCMKRIGEAKEFDLQTTVLSIECFSEFINLVLLHFKKKFSNFLFDISGVGVENGIRVQLQTMVDNILDELLTVVKDGQDLEVKEEEVHIRKISILLVTCATTLTSELQRGGLQAQQLLEKMKNICKETKIEAPNVARAILSLFLVMYIKCKSSGGVLMDLVLCLTDHVDAIDDEVKFDDHTSYAIINENTACACLLAICDTLQIHINEVEWLVSRLKSELLMCSFSLREPPEARKEELYRKERELCRHINFLAKVLSILCELAVPPGIYSDAILKEVGNFYNKLTLVTKYFISKVGKYHQDLQATRFDKTVKMVDCELSRNMYFFTEHIIAEGTGNKGDNSNKQNKRDLTLMKNKSLRDTKTIPKVIFEKEQFLKYVLVLSNKSKMDLTAHTKHTMARDYRLYAKQVKEFLDKENIQMEEIETDADSQHANEESNGSPNKKRQKLSQ